MLKKDKERSEAVPGRGPNKKMKRYSVNGKRIFIMSLPIFAELFLQLMVGNVDQIMLSGYSYDSVAAIGNANTVINLVIVILTMASSGGMIALTHYIGANDEKRMKDAVIWTFVLSAAFGLIFTLVSVSAATPLLYALNAPEEIVGQASGYITVVGAGLLIQAAQLAGTAVLRSFSRLKEILIISVVMNLTNILGNWLLINGIWIFPEYGILGAAISTDVSKLIGLLITLAVMIKRVPVKVRISDIKALDAATFKDIVKIALPTGGETASYNLSQIVVLSFINLFGTAVINTKVYCSMLANVAYLYSIAIAQSTQINIGYLVGAGEYSTVSSRVAKTTAVCIGVSVTLTAILWLTSDFILGFLTDDAEVLQLAKAILLIEIALELGRSVNIVMTRHQFPRYRYCDHGMGGRSGHRIFAGSQARLRAERNMDSHGGGRDTARYILCVTFCAQEVDAPHSREGVSQTRFRCKGNRGRLRSSQKTFERAGACDQILNSTGIPARFGRDFLLFVAKRSLHVV